MKIYYSKQHHSLEMDTRYLLTCLGYPLASSINFEDRNEFIQAIVWLEDRKIRELEINEREGLRALSKDWDAEFVKYLDRLGCSLCWNPEISIECLNWLVSHAVALEYEENVELCDNIELKSSSEESSNDCVKITSSLVSKLGKLVEREKLPEEDDIDYLHRISKAVQSLSASSQYFSKGEAQAPSQQSTISSHNDLSPDTQALTLDDFPIEFDSGDKVVNQIAVVLKMLHLADLRELQSDVNSLVVLCQEYTANPKTNSALGQVGR